MQNAHRDPQSWRREIARVQAAANSGDLGTLILRKHHTNMIQICTTI